MNEPITAQSIALASLRAVQLKPGDIVVLTFPEKLSPRNYQEWVDACDAVFAGHECLLLDGDADLSILRTVEPERPKLRPFPRRKAVLP